MYMCGGSLKNIGGVMFCYVGVALFGILLLAFTVETVEGIKVMGFHNRLVKVGLIFLVIGGGIFSILVIRLIQYWKQGFFF